MALYIHSYSESQGSFAYGSFGALFKSLRDLFAASIRCTVLSRTSAHGQCNIHACQTGMGALSSVSAFNPKRAPTFVYIRATSMCVSDRWSHKQYHRSPHRLHCHQTLAEVPRGGPMYLCFHRQASMHRHHRYGNTDSETFCKQSFLPQIRVEHLKTS